MRCRSQIQKWARPSIPVFGAPDGSDVEAGASGIGVKVKGFGATMHPPVTTYDSYLRGSMVRSRVDNEVDLIIYLASNGATRVEVRPYDDSGSDQYTESVNDADPGQWVAHRSWFDSYSDAGSPSKDGQTGGAFFMKHEGP